MTVFVPIKELEAQFADLAERVKAGETVVVTQDGEPVFDLTPHQPPKERKGGINYEKGEAYLRARGITDPFPFVADDFDAPLPEDFLIKPLP